MQIFGGDVGFRALSAVYDRRRMRSENIDWSCELRADSGKTLNSHKTSNILATNSRREWRSSEPHFPGRKFASWNTNKRLRLRTILAPKANGFTLLEIMVAVAILAISLVALLNFQGNTMITSGRAERITEATMLAKMKMAEVELDLEKVQKRGEFPEEKSEEGNFEEPFERYKWRVTIKSVKLPAPVTGEEGSVQTLIGRQLTEEIGKTVRELTVEVLWEEMGEEQKIDVVTHIVKL